MFDLLGSCGKEELVFMDSVASAMALLGTVSFGAGFITSLSWFRTWSICVKKISAGLGLDVFECIR